MSTLMHSLEDCLHLKNFQESITGLFDACTSNPYPDYKYRIAGLKRLERKLLECRFQIQTALRQDFYKPDFETDASELLTCLAELRKARRELKKWMSDRSVSTPIELLGSSHKIRCEPKGVVLIISPWNYPVNLCLVPFIAAWSAGNRVVIKPSEFAPAAAIFIEEIIYSCFNKNEVLVIRGGEDLAHELTTLPFHHIFFTGSQRVAQKVMQSASKHLTPFTLELGGKTPLIIDENVNISKIIKDIVFAKCLNAGQTCISPDFVLLPKGMLNEFCDEWVKTIREYYGEDPVNSEIYSGVINEMHYNRLMRLIEDSKQAGARTHGQLQTDRSRCRIAPVLLIDSDWDAPSMSDEIFGPVLPVIEYDNINTCVDELAKMKCPLALYIYSNNQENIKYLSTHIRSGGLSINNCLLNYCNFNLPFGGKHQSGFGYSHGKYGFESFSHIRGISKQGKWYNSLRNFHPPYTNYKTRLLNIALKLIGKI